MWSRILLLLLVLAWSVSLPAGEEEDRRQWFREAQRALLKGDPARYRALAQRLRDYLLYPYLEYESLLLRLRRAHPAEVARFLERYADTPLAPLLRRRWLRRLGEQRRWREYLSFYLPQRDPELRCFALRARLAGGESPERIWPWVRDLWLVGTSLPKGCDPLFEQWYASGGPGQALIWSRVVLAMGEGETRLAKYLARRLQGDYRRRFGQWLALRREPARLLRDPALRGSDGPARTLLVDGLLRLARSDVEQALARWRELEPAVPFLPRERARVLRSLAIAAVRQESGLAAELLGSLPPAAQDATLRRYRLRWALAHEAWKRLLAWSMAATWGPVPHRWRYWQGRAMELTGRTEAGRRILERLASERDYYGFLAAERLGRPHHYAGKPVRAGREEIGVVAADPAIARAHELWLLGMNGSARREWSFAMDRLGPRFWPAAAWLAGSWGWHDRAIVTLGRARSYDDLDLRFPVAWRGEVLRQAQRHGLDPALVLGLMRAESAFIEDAVSPAGALGLMQLMPATGRRMAKVIGHPLRHRLELLQADNNIPIGTAYLKKILGRFGGNPVLAIASYNAGPHRVRRWLPEQGCESAERWIEQIPFNETRRYVRRVLFYTTLYHHRLQGEQRPLRSWLVPVPSNHQLAARRLECDSRIQLTQGEQP